MLLRPPSVLYELRRRTHAQRQLELEARVGILEAVTEQLAQPAEPVADGLRMHVEGAGHRLCPPALSEPRVERGGEALPREAGLAGEWRERRLGHVGRQPAVVVEQ